MNPVQAKVSAQVYSEKFREKQRKTTYRANVWRTDELVDGPPIKTGFNTSFQPIVHGFRDTSNNHIFGGIWVMAMSPEPPNSQGIRLNVVGY